MTGTGTEIIVGGETVEARDEFLKCIVNVFYKINAAADNKSLNDLCWTLDYYTDVLISNILESKIRDQMRVAKTDIYEAEIIKLKSTTKEKLTDEQQKQAKISACTTIIGEIRQHLDKYFGMEKQLAVML